MSEENHVRISALLDHESGPDELEHALRDLADDPVLRGTAARYRLIGEALRGERVRHDATSLVERVRDSVAGEPPIVAPSTVPRVPTPSRRGMAPVARLAAGFAIAASVAVVAIAIFPGTDPVGTDSGAEVALAPGLPQRGLVPATRVGLAPEPGSTAPADAQQAPSWDRYLLDHDEFAARGPVRGIRPHATLVTFDGR